MSIENPTKINKFLVSYINDKSSEEYQEFIKIINDDDLLDLVDRRGNTPKTSRSPKPQNFNTGGRSAGYYFS